MTTSTPSSSSRGWFSPERIVLVLPIVLGVGVGSLLVMAGVVPVVVQLKQTREQVELMELKQIGLPALRERLRILEGELLQMQEQQTRLVDLVAGPNQLKTLLATLNTLTEAAGIQVTALESKPVVRYVPPAPPPESDGEPTDLPPAPPTDPLLRPGLERRSVVIGLQGSYPALLGFLRELEALEVVAITTELTMLNSGEPDELTQLTLEMSAYGRS